MRNLSILALLAATLFAVSAMNAQVRVLPHHHPQWANSGNDLGVLPADQKLDPMTIVLARSPEQEAAFEKLLAEQQNPASPEYHHWLTPAEIGERFGGSEEEISGMTGWLQSQGLRVNWVSPSRLFIGFSGTAADVSRAFQTEVHRYNVHGVERISIASDPMIPAALAPSVKAIHGLYAIEEKPLHLATQAQSNSPLMDAGGSTHFIVPADFATIYDLPVNFKGVGQTIGIVGRSRTNFADFYYFQDQTESSFSNPTEIIPTAFGGVDPGPAYTSPPASYVSLGDQLEATLDVQRAGSTAPAANLLLVVATQASGGVEADAQYLVNTTPLPAQVMTISFGYCESSAGPSGVDFWNTLFQQAAAEGISTFVSSGDSGASGCDTSFTTPPAGPSANSPNYICSSSYVTCVGGSEFNDASAPSAYWNSSNSNNLASATSYIPEGGWNEPLNSESEPQAASSGGGVSTVIATPSWQTGTGVPAARSGRYTPDIAFSASCHDGYFGCFAASGASCVADTSGEFYFLGFCGTSAAAPSMAGIAALLNQDKGEPQGNLNPQLYKLAASTPAAFHDITVATSGVSGCNVNTPSMCNNSIPSSSGLSGGQAGFLVTNGYDLVTGLGSLNVANFLNGFTAKIVPTVAVTPSANTITVLQGLTVTIAVSGSTGNPTPTGTVTLTSGSYTSAATSLSKGGATINIPAGSLISGYDTLTVNYTTDLASSTTYSVASGASMVLVNLVNPTITVTPSSSSITTAQALTVTVVVNGGSGNPTPTGTVFLNGGGYNGSGTVVGGSVTLKILAGLLTPGSDYLSASYSPDTQASATYNSASASSTVTVTAAAPNTPTVTVAPPSTLTGFQNNLQPLPITISVSGGTGNPTPTGSVTLTSGGYTSAAAPLSKGGAIITIPAGKLAVGYDQLTVIYAPDTASSATYINTSGSASIYNTQSVPEAPQIAVTPSSTAITTAQSLSVQVTVYALSYDPGATGTVKLTGIGYTSPATPLSSGSATVNIPAGALPVGTDTLTAAYTPDTASAVYYTGAKNTASVTVSTPPPPSFTVTGTSVSLAAGATSGNTTTITVQPIGGFTDSVTLTAEIVDSPANAVNPPVLSFGATSPVSITGTNPGTATLTITTTASKTSALSEPARPGARWFATGGAALACLLLFGIPARRRRWRNLLGMMALFAALTGGLLACGGGSGSTGGGGNSGTTPGAYTITVTGRSGTISATGTVVLTVE